MYYILERERERERHTQRETEREREREEEEEEEEEERTLLFSSFPLSRAHINSIQRITNIRNATQTYN